MVASRMKCRKSELPREVVRLGGVYSGCEPAGIAFEGTPTPGDPARGGRGGERIARDPRRALNFTKEFRLLREYFVNKNENAVLTGGKIYVILLKISNEGEPGHEAPCSKAQYAPRSLSRIRMVRDFSAILRF